MNAPDVSIIVPVYNAENHLPGLISSVLGQSLSAWELILVNDGAADSSQEIIRQYAEKDSRIRLISQSNAGPSAARNRGIAEARAAWMAFIDADDTVTPDYLEKLMEPLAANSSVDLVCAGYYEQNRYNRQGIPLHDFSGYFPAVFITPDQFIDNLFSGVAGVLWSKLFRTSLIRDNRLSLNTGLKLSEDLVFVLQYVKHCRRVALVKAPLYYYNRISESGLSSNLDVTYIPGIRKFNELIVQEHPGNPDAVAELLSRKTAQLALQIIKAQSAHPARLKETCERITREFGPLTAYRWGMEEYLLVQLLARKQFRMAAHYVKTLQLLRKIKNEKENTG